MSFFFQVEILFFFCQIRTKKKNRQGVADESNVHEILLYLLCCEFS